METAVQVEDFPDYLIEKDGTVYTARNGMPRRPSVNQNGLVKITLYRDGQPHTKSLALLVAKAHLWNDRDPEIFDTPIHLDNDPSNNHVDNLAWRPRWFAVKYQKQYWNENYRFSKVRVVEVETGEVYDSIMQVCQRYGVLFIDVMNSCLQGTAVFPTWKTFRFE